MKKIFAITIFLLLSSLLFAQGSQYQIIDGNLIYRMDIGWNQYHFYHEDKVTDISGICVGDHNADGLLLAITYEDFQSLVNKRLPKDYTADEREEIYYSIIAELDGILKKISKITPPNTVTNVKELQNWLNLNEEIKSILSKEKFSCEIDYFYLKSFNSERFVAGKIYIGIQISSEILQ